MRESLQRTARAYLAPRLVVVVDPGLRLFPDGFPGSALRVEPLGDPPDTAPVVTPAPFEAPAAPVAAPAPAPPAPPVPAANDIVDEVSARPAASSIVAIFMSIAPL